MLCLRQFVPKNQNYQLKLKFGTYTNSNMQNSMVIFTFSAFDWAYTFSANLVQKIKIVSSRWNFRLKLIQICRIQCWCSLFLFLSGNTLSGQIWSKNQNYQSKLKIGNYTNSNMQIQWWYSLFLFLIGNTLFGQI